MLDNDKQGNLSKGYGKYDAEREAPVTKLLKGEWGSTAELIQQTDYNGLDIITANMSLFGAVWNLIKESPADMLGRYRRLMDAETEDGRKVREKYDYCIIDNPPDIGLNVLNALMVTDEVVVPVKIDDIACQL